MPANRMLHKRAGSGERTNALSNLEFRAWIIYRLAADDFGVLRCDIGSLIEAHPYFAKEKPRALKAALERLVNIGLLGRFTSQGLTYLYSRDWQDFERIEWPSMTTKPTVPPDFLEGCTPETQRLFSVWPGQKRIPPVVRLRTDNVPPESQVPSDDVATTSPPRAKANAMANAMASDSPEDLTWRFWREAHQRQSGVILRNAATVLEFQKLSEFCGMVPDASTRGALIIDFLALSEKDAKALNVKAKTLGYLVMSVPMLLERRSTSEDAELAKFVAGGR